MQEKWGKLEEGGFSRLLHDIFVTKDKASALDIESGKIKKRFFFKTGIPVYALSNILSEVLGRLMVRKGIISQETYEKSLEIMVNDIKKHSRVVAFSARTVYELEDFQPTMQERKILTLIDGRKTLNNIITELEARAVKKEEFYRFIYGLT